MCVAVRPAQHADGQKVLERLFSICSAHLPKHSVGPARWLGSYFSRSMKPLSSSAVKWKQQSAVRKCISLAVIRGALSERHAPSAGKITAGQIVFATLSTCYFISQMENNNAGSGVWKQPSAADRASVDFYKYLWSLYMESGFLKNFWAQRKSAKRLIQYTMIDDKVADRQSIGYWGKSCWISMLIKNKIKRREYFQSAGRAGIFQLTTVPPPQSRVN